MKNQIMNLKRNIKRAGLVLKKNGPQIATYLGCIGAATAAVMACKETLKLEETIDEHKIMKLDIQEAYATQTEEEFPEADYKKAIRKNQVDTVMDVAKLYAPSVVLGGLSIGAIVGSSRTMKKRNASLAAAYATLNNMYKSYRKNVVDTFGADIDRDMRYGITHETVEDVSTDGDGKTHKSKKKVDVVNNPLNGLSDYARIFDETCPAFERNPEINLMYLRGVESYCNNLLKANGYLFLNDVYKQIGFEPSIAGQSVGWIYDSENPVGDNYIDFGIYSNANKRFINGLEPAILLDFNVDGDILNSPLLKLWRK